MQDIKYIVLRKNSIDDAKGDVGFILSEHTYPDGLKLFEVEMAKTRHTRFLFQDEIEICHLKIDPVEPNRDSISISYDLLEAYPPKKRAHYNLLDFCQRLSDERTELKKENRALKAQL